VRQLHFYLAVSPLTVAYCRFRPLAIGQVEHEPYALIQPSLEARGTDQHRHAAATFVEVLFLIRLSGSGRLQLCLTSVVGIAPFGRRQFPPAQATRDEIQASATTGAALRVDGGVVDTIV
jgi:hypothetical protein